MKIPRATNEQIQLAIEQSCRGNPKAKDELLQQVDEAGGLQKWWRKMFIENHLVAKQVIDGS